MRPSTRIVVLGKRTPKPKSAYSLRKLYSQYTGNAIRVRRDSDNAELDIGFDANGDLNTTALMSHVSVYQNLLQRSEEIDQAPWLLDNNNINASNPIVTSNFGLAPNNSLTAERIQLNRTGGTFSRVQQAVTGLTSDIYTYSVYLKNNAVGTANVGIRVGTTSINCIVTQEWQRFSVTVSTATATPVCQILLWSSISGNDTTADILAWGNQLNQGSTPQQYQVTTAAASKGDGFVTIWYDQSGNNNHAFQTTNSLQPKVVNSNVLQTLNNKPTIVFTPNQYLNYPTISGQLDICLIAKHRTGSQDSTPILGHSTLFNFHGGVGTFLFNTSNSVIKDNAGSLIINGGGSLPSTAIKPTNLSSIAIKVASATVNNLSVDRVTTGRYWDGNYSEAIFFENQNINLSSIYLDQMSYFSITQAADLKFAHLIFDGNSLTVGQGGSPYSSLITPFLNTDYTYSLVNYGVGGQTTSAMLEDANTQVDTTSNISREKNVVVCWEGINDIYFGATATQAYNNLVSYCTSRRAYGFKVVIVTLTPRQNTNTPSFQETRRLEVNSLIRSNWTTFADALADVAADNRLGDYDDCLNTTYYTADKVHMNNTGYTIVAQIVASAVNTLI